MFCLLCCISLCLLRCFFVFFFGLYFPDSGVYRIKCRALEEIKNKVVGSVVMNWAIKGDKILLPVNMYLDLEESVDNIGFLICEISNYGYHKRFTESVGVLNDVSPDDNMYIPSEFMKKIKAKSGQTVKLEIQSGQNRPPPCTKIIVACKFEDPLHAYSKSQQLRAIDGALCHLSLIRKDQQFRVRQPYSEKDDPDSSYPLFVKQVEREEGPCKIATIVNRGTFNIEVRRLPGVGVGVGDSVISR